MAYSTTRTSFLIHCLSLCCYPVLTVVAGNVVLLAVPQATEILQALDVPSPAGKERAYLLHFVLFLAAMSYWCGSAWYCSRALLGKRFPQDSLAPCKDARFGFYTGLWLPRLLGMGGSVPIASYFVSHDFPLQEQVATAALAAAFLLFVVFRRPWLRRRGRLKGWTQLSTDPFPRFYHLHRHGRLFIVLMLSVSGLVLAAIMIGREDAARNISAPALLLLALGSWTLFGSMVLIYLPRSQGWPSLAMAPIVVGLACSLWNENHFVAQTARPASTVIRPGLEQDFKAWNDARGDHGNEPVYLVAAAGGASRAAYWTGRLLTNLENEARLHQRRFADNIYAVSGVSGGSLGLAAFVGALAGETGGRDVPLSPRPTEFLKQDFLSPVIAYMLYPDAIARFLPWPCVACDRSRGLEESWTRDWAAAHPNPGWFDRPMADIAGASPAHRLPRMLLNTTSVSDGRRVVQSDLAFSPPEAHDLLDAQFDTQRLTLAQAVHNSARFTYVSPAAQVFLKAGHQPWDFVVDGGYFENSGVASFNAMLHTLHTSYPQLRFVVITIENEPADASAWICPQHAPPAVSTPAPVPTELTAPALALYATRGARAGAAEAEAARLLGQCASGNLIELRYPELRSAEQIRRNQAGAVKEPPMSWFLNVDTRYAMDHVLCAPPQRTPALDRLAGEWRRLLEIMGADARVPAGHYTPEDRSFACPGQ